MGLQTCFCEKTNYISDCFEWSQDSLCLSTFFYFVTTDDNSLNDKIYLFAVRSYQTQLIMIIISIGISALTSSLANTRHTTRRVPAAIRKVSSAVIYY